jgi:hypothetical protein
MFKQKPYTGVGAGGGNFIGYRVSNNIDDIAHPGVSAEAATQSHILYGQVLAELGVFGALLFAGMVFSIAWSSILSIQNLSKLGKYDGFANKLSWVILASLAMLLLLGFSGHNFYRPLWLWLAAWSGSLLRITRGQLPGLSNRENFYGQP